MGQVVAQQACHCPQVLANGVCATADCPRLDPDCAAELGTCTSDAQCTAGGGDSCDADVVDFSAELNVILAGDTFDTAEAPQTVTLGWKDSQWVEVVKGLQETDRVRIRDTARRNGGT